MFIRLIRGCGLEVVTQLLKNLKDTKIYNDGSVTKFNFKKWCSQGSIILWVTANSMGNLLFFTKKGSQLVLFTVVAPSPRHHPYWFLHWGILRPWDPTWKRQKLFFIDYTKLKYPIEETVVWKKESICKIAFTLEILKASKIPFIFNSNF